jgi:hypothetical protein
MPIARPAATHSLSCVDVNTPAFNQDGILASHRCILDRGKLFDRDLALRCSVQCDFVPDKTG